MMDDSPDSRESLAAALLSGSRPGRTGQAPDEKEKNIKATRHTMNFTESYIKGSPTDIS
jgi:hypothetical protein